MINCDSHREARSKRCKLMFRGPAIQKKECCRFNAHKLQECFSIRNILRSPGQKRNCILHKQGSIFFILFFLTSEVMAFTLFTQATQFLKSPKLNHFKSFTANLVYELVGQACGTIERTTANLNSIKKKKKIPTEVNISFSLTQ